MTTYTCDVCAKSWSVVPTVSAGNGMWLFVEYAAHDGTVEPFVLCSLECLAKWTQERIGGESKNIEPEQSVLLTRLHPLGRSTYQDSPDGVPFGMEKLDDDQKLVQYVIGRG